MSKYFHPASKSQNDAGFCSLLTRICPLLMILVLVWSLVGVVPTSVLAAGSTYYVDNTVSCSDTGPGTQAQPFCTIGKGATAAKVAGDTVNVLHGSYAETVYFNTYSGTAGNPITFHAEPGVTVTGNASGAVPGFGISSVSYLVIDGFSFDHTNTQGIYVNAANHITLTNNHVAYAGEDYTPHPYTQGIYLRNTTYSTITGNTSDHNTCIGIRVVLGDHNLISNNISFSNYSVVETDAAGIELTGSSYNTVINNITYSNEDSGINIYLYTGTPVTQSTYNLVIGNLSYENGDHGIDNNNAPYNTIIGNTIEGNGTVGLNFEGEAGTGSHHAIAMNNIIVGNGLTPPQVSFGGNLRVDSNSVDGTTVDYNLFDRQGAALQIIWNNVPYTTFAAFRAAVPSQEVHGLVGDPLFVDSVPPALRNDSIPYVGAGIVGDYHLMSGSPAIDSANSDAPSESLLDIEGKARIDDPATPNTGAGSRAYDDRGAYEFQPETASCYTLTLNHAGQGGNPVASPTNSTGCWTGRYIAGASISLSGAVPATGWRINGWTGTNDNASTASTNTATMPASALTVGVTYTQIQYTLTITSAHGTVAKNPDKATYTYGEVVQLTATPAGGWSFTNWSGGASGASNPISVTMNANTSVTANYSQVPPDTTITSQPANPTKNTTASFDFTSNDATATFECRLDAGSFAACTSPKNYTGLADGLHTFDVRAKNAAGTDSTPASFAWTVDIVAPDTQIDSQPANPSNSTNATFNFSSADSTATFECRLDSASFSTCTNPKDYTGLAAGSHTFEVHAKDDAGNIDPTPASYSWTVNLGAATLVSPNGSIGTNTPNYTWNKINGATWYYLWVSKLNTDGSSTAIHSKWYDASVCGSTTCSVTPAGVTLSAGNYRWWIQTWNDGGYGLWSDGMDFILPVPPLPGQATLVSPSGSIGMNTPNYTWNKVNGATWYYLWISQLNADGSSTTIHNKWYDASVCGSTTCSVTPTGVTLSAGNYRWWIQTWNDGGYGPWSDKMDFTLPVPPLPGAATLVSPNGSIGTNTPNYTWNKVNGATWYYLWVSKLNTDGSSTTIHSKWYDASVCGSTTCSVTPAGVTLSAGNYRWWIQTWNDGGYGPWSDGMDFSSP